MHKFEVSAPGKIILFGEHAVVYGSPALAVSVGIHTHLVVSPSNDFTIYLEEYGFEHSFSLSFLQKIFDSKSKNLAMKELLEINVSNSEINNALWAIFNQYVSVFNNPVAMKIYINSELPIGGGVGSSAAFSVCVATAMLHASGEVSNELTEIERRKISSRALECERLFHNRPSGIDNTVCTYGGAVLYQSQSGIEKLEVSSLKVLLIYSDVTRSTKTIVDKVRSNREKFPSIYDPIFATMSEITKKAVEAMKSDDSEVLNSLIKINHGLLSAIDVSHEKLDQIVWIARSHGISAKLTGAGGGGFAVALINEVDEAVVDDCIAHLEENGFICWNAETCVNGVVIHSK